MRHLLWLPSSFFFLCPQQCLATLRSRFLLLADPPSCDSALLPRSACALRRMAACSSHSRASRSSRAAARISSRYKRYFSAPGQPVAVFDYDVTFIRRRGPPPREALEAAKGSAGEAGEDAGGLLGGAEGERDGEGFLVGAAAAGAGVEGADGLVCVLTPKAVVQCVDG